VLARRDPQADGQGHLLQQPVDLADDECGCGVGLLREVGTAAATVGQGVEQRLVVAQPEPEGAGTHACAPGVRRNTSETVGVGDAGVGVTVAEDQQRRPGRAGYPPRFLQATEAARGQVGAPSGSPRSGHGPAHPVDRRYDRLVVLAVTGKQRNSRKFTWYIY